jgi:hypothetical protein
MLQSPCSLNETTDLSSACKHYATPKILQKRVENWIKLLTKRDQDKLGTRYQWHKVRTLKISLLSRTTALVYQMKVGEVQAPGWVWPLPMLYVVLKPKCERARLWFVLHGDYWIVSKFLCECEVSLPSGQSQQQQFQTLVQTWGDLQPPYSVLSLQNYGNEHLGK